MIQYEFTHAIYQDTEYRIEDLPYGVTVYDEDVTLVFKGYEEEIEDVA